MRSLVLSGGGAKGAYQAGVLTVLLGEEGNRYDIVCGISVGALNGALVAMYKPGEELDAAGRLLELWGSIRGAESIYRARTFGKLAALWRPSVYDTAPLRALIKKHLDVGKLRASGKKLAVGAVSLTSGRYQLFSGEDADIVEGVMASSAFPGMFEPVAIRNELWTDGGVREVTPLGAAIDLGATDVDVVLCSPAGVSRGFDKTPNVLQVAERTVDIMSEEIVDNDLKLCAAYNSSKGRRQVRVRVIRPASVLLESSLDFDPKKIRGNIDRGRLDGLKALENS